MSTPAIAGIHHVTLTVTDSEASAEWYRDVLGFEITKHVDQNELHKVMISRPGLFMVLVSHGDQAVPGPFSERRNGLDHLGFALADRAALDEWVAALDAAGVDHSAITQGSTGSLVAFRDPDNVALEFYTLS
ncbi:MAG: VOC family protein [Rhodoglobus sp.]